MFQPSGRQSKMCDECIEKSRADRVKRMKATLKNKKSIRMAKNKP